MIEEVGETSDGEGDYEHDWKAVLAESEVERKQSNIKSKTRSRIASVTDKKTRCLEDQAPIIARRTRCGALGMEEARSKVEYDLVDDKFSFTRPWETA